jgi:hypothetical protein
LRELRSGDEVTVTLSDGSATTFVVVRRERISKEVVDYDSILTRADGMLVLVTCGGSYDPSSRHYADNVIVWAASTEVP